jgi:acetyl-CoA carboxylase carboxyl transferase subunit beta
MIGFAGPRVKGCHQSELPAGFQTAEFLKDHGLIDAIIPTQGTERTPQPLL